MAARSVFSGSFVPIILARKVLAPLRGIDRVLRQFDQFQVMLLAFLLSFIDVHQQRDNTISNCRRDQNCDHIPYTTAPWRRCWYRRFGHGFDSFVSALEPVAHKSVAMNTIGTFNP